MRPPCLIALLITMFVAWPAPARADEHVETYDEAMARARVAGEAGKFRAAVAILRPIVEAYPQDYDVALSLAFYAYSAGDFADAERAYREALLRAPASVEARLGLAWTYVQRLRCEEAARELEPISQDPRAAEVLRTCAGAKLGAGKTAEIGLSYVQSHFPGDRTKLRADGVFVRAAVRVSSDWALGLSYRHLAVATHSASSVAPFAQDELYAHAAWSSPTFGVGLHAAVVSDGSGGIGASRHAGVVGRYTSFGDLQVEATVSGYRDRTITRLAPSWTLPIVGPLRLVPGFAVQAVNGEALLNASLSVLLDWPGLSLWASGRYGLEERPAYLERSVVYGITNRVEWGLTAGFRLRFSEGFGVAGSYSYDRLHVDDGSTTSALHTLTLGPVITF